ncbi:universal stress protein PHOS34 isoform X2 [Humulus lupulus]|uniref:universal stress protein PHOS34 isoform X2 n=1 Tax=Humulus lupulus TaxID=3486 RepID=UPI002B40D07F|nr:universal stress protein PHOS34 isoform X2 [Humulus lupulus]
MAEMRRRRKMKVMVAMDDSECSFYALKWALDHVFVTPEMGTVLAEEPSSDEADMVVLVHVQQPFQHYAFPAGPAVYATTSVVESVKKAQEENSTALMSRALQMCRTKPSIKAETLILEGDPKDRICNATEQMQMDLLVVGSRGLGTIKRAFLGSVSDYCAHHAKCPILIVRPPKETTATK